MWRELQIVRLPSTRKSPDAHISPTCRQHLLNVLSSPVMQMALQASVRPCPCEGGGDMSPCAAPAVLAACPCLAATAPRRGRLPLLLLSGPAHKARFAASTQDVAGYSVLPRRVLLSPELGDSIPTAAKLYHLG